MSSVWRLCINPYNPHYYRSVVFVNTLIQQQWILDTFFGIEFVVYNFFTAFIHLAYCLELTDTTHFKSSFTIIDTSIKLSFVTYYFYYMMKPGFICLRSFYRTWCLSRPEKDAIHAHQ